jgi:hypothetical protein
MTATELSFVAGALLSLAFSYVPGLNSKFAALEPEKKRLVMLGLLALVSLVVFGLGCAGFAADLGLSVTCDRAGAVGLLKAFLGAVVANQAMYSLSPRTLAVKLAKAG